MVWSVIIVIILFLIILYLSVEPSIDTIMLNNKKTKILWYNGTNGRNWVVLW